MKRNEVVRLYVQITDMWEMPKYLSGEEKREKFFSLAEKILEPCDGLDFDSFVLEVFREFARFPYPGEIYKFYNSDTIKNIVPSKNKRVVQPIKEEEKDDIDSDIPYEWVRDINKGLRARGKPVYVYKNGDIVLENEIDETLV